MKYNLRYYAECFYRDAPSERALLRARTFTGAKEEAERRFRLHVPGDMLRVLGVVKADTYPENGPVVVVEHVFPKAGWVESDDAWWFRMAEEEEALLDGMASRDEKPGVNPDKVKTVADALGIRENRFAALVRDYGDIISGLPRVEIMTCADAARRLGVSRGRIDQLRRKGRVGEPIRLSGRYFLRRDSVEAFAERRRKYLKYWENAAKMRRERLAGRGS